MAAMERGPLPQSQASDDAPLVHMNPAGMLDGADSALDLDVTVLAFAQWVSQMKTRQHNSQHQMQAEMSIIRNAITSNNTDLADFKRHSASIQRQMQSEINEIRESLSNVFMEITAAVSNNAAADQDIKLKIQSLNEQAVRNETAFAQLADAADQSQSKLRGAVEEMQMRSERMRDELTQLNRYTESLEGTLTERGDRMSSEIEGLGQEQHSQLQRRKQHLEKMVNDVGLIGDSLQNLMTDFGEQKRNSGEVQNRLQSSLFVLDQSQRKDAGPPLEDGRGRLRAVPESLTVTNDSLAYPQASSAQNRTVTPVRQAFAPQGVPGPYAAQGPMPCSQTGPQPITTISATARTLPLSTGMQMPAPGQGPGPTMRAYH